MSNYTKISLSNICGGAAVEMFDKALAEVIANILDYNTEAKKERKITLEIIVKPIDEERRTVDYDINIKTKLTPDRGVKSTMYVGQKDGELIAMEEDVKQVNLPFSDDAEVIKFKEVKNAND